MPKPTIQCGARRPNPDVSRRASRAPRAFDALDEGRAMPVTIELQSLEEARALCGLNDKHLNLIRDQLKVGIYTRQGTIRLEGDNGGVEKAATSARRPIR